MNKGITLKGNEQILVVRTDRIGDLVLTTPVFEALRNHYPNLKMDALVSDYASPILENNPHIDRVLICNSTGRRSLLETLRQNKYDLAILVHPRPEMAWLAFRAGIPVRIATAFRWYSFLFTHRIYQHRSRIEKHESEYNLELLQPLGLHIGKILPKIYLSKNETGAAEAFLRDCGLTQNDLKVIIHPGGGRSSLRWPEEKFGQLALRLRHRFSARILVTGEKREKISTDKVMQNLNQRAVDLTGKLNLRELAAVISRADLVVTNSTGPMHLAAALGIRVVGLFCPITTASPVRWGPCGPGHITLQPSLKPCRCSIEKCKRGNCMELIETKEVFRAAENILNEIRTGVKIQ